MGSSSPPDAELRTSLRRQEVVAEVGRRALRVDDFDRLLHDASSAVAEALDTDVCGVFKRHLGSDELVLRQGVGWNEGRVGTATVPAGRGSQAGDTLHTGEPTVVEDWGTDERAITAELLTDHDVVSGISVVVGSVDDPWGVLGAYSTARRGFSRQDATFVQSVANVLASAIENEGTRRELEEIYDRISDGFFALDREWRFTCLNERAHELINPGGRKLAGTDFWQAVPETIDRTVVAKYERAMSAQEPVSFESYYPEPLDVWFEVRIYPSETGLSVYFRDVTERTARQRELEESERRYRTLVEHFPNGAVTLVDDELRYRTVGGSPLDVADVTAEEAEGKPVRDALPSNLADVLVPRYEDALDGMPQTFERDFGGRSYQFQIVPVRDDDGEIFAAMGMSQDVTERKERERYLYDAKSQLEAATDAGAVGTWEWDVQEDVMVVGPSFARTFGVDPDAAGEGVSLDQFVAAVHEDDRDRVVAAIDEAVETCGEYEAEYRVRNDAGEVRWVVARGRVECDEAGTPLSFPGALTDITERKRAELELERSTEQLERLFEILPVGVVVAEAGGEIVAANDTATDIWGGDVFDAESIEEYDRYPVFQADTGEQVAPEEMTLARVVNGEEVTEPDVYEIHAADGERRTIELLGMPVRDESGRVARGVVTLADVTERRAAQRRLEESEQRYRTLVEHFPNGAVGLFDEDLRYTVAGGNALAEVDTASEEIVGKTIWERYPEAVAERLEPHFQAALAGETSTFELAFHDRRWQAYTLPITDGDGDTFAGMMVVQDITEQVERKQQLEELVERLEASNERLEQFAYAASHDLQEPLRMVSSYLQLIERRYGADLDEAGREFIEFAVDGAERMREMIDGLLEYSRIERRGDPFEPVDLDDVLADVRGDLRVAIEEHDAEIHCEPLPRVEGDASQLRQVFQNLLDNAIEYSGDDTPRIHVSAEREGEAWVVSVRDDGIGIDPADAERIFQTFQRLHSHDEHEGAGIGLALCQRIVERHGGEIWVESALGEGATFSFTLPAVDRDT